MDIYYQWIRGSYSHSASLQAKKWLADIQHIIWVELFDTVRYHIQEGAIGVLPIENSYAWSIHTNMYNFLRYDCRIIWEIILPIQHCLLSHAKNIQDIKTTYSHPQALAQCYQFLKKYTIKWVERSNTASAAKYVASSPEKNIAAIASNNCSTMYGIPIITEGIEDQQGNTTRFIIVAKNNTISYKHKTNKTSVLFETKDVAWALCRCLWCFAHNGINITKIESLPSYTDPFHYLFWIDIQGNVSSASVQQALQELSFCADTIKIVGTY